MKKILTLISVLSVLSVMQTAFAEIGYVDYSRVQNEYSLAKKYNGELMAKSKEINNYKAQQEKIIKNTKAPADKEKIRKESIKQIQTRNSEWMSLKNKYEKELTANVKAAAEKVRANNGYDIILKSNDVVTGGVDCTNDVLNLLK